MPNGISNCYQLEESISVLRVVGGIFHFYSNFKRNFCKQTVKNNKKNARIIWVNEFDPFRCCNLNHWLILLKAALVRFYMHNLFNTLRIQSNLVNSKSSALEFLFRIVSSLNYREVDIKSIYTPPKTTIFFSIKHKKSLFTHQNHMLL